MKQKTVDKVIWLYKFWSVILLAVFVFLADYRLEVFNVRIPLHRETDSA